MKTTIKKTLEIEIDLNSYYPNFPASLKKLICDAIVGSATGIKNEKPKRHIEVPKEPAHVISWTKKKTRDGGLTGAILKKIFLEKNEILLEDFQDEVEKELRASGRKTTPQIVRSWIRNLIRDEHIRV